MREDDIHGLLYGCKWEYPCIDFLEWCYNLKNDWGRPDAGGLLYPHVGPQAALPPWE